MADDPLRTNPAPRIAINGLNLPPNLAGIGFYLRKLLEHMVRLEPQVRFTLFTNRQAAPSLTDLAGIEVRPYPAPNAAIRSIWSIAALPFSLSGFRLVHSIGNVGLPFCPIPQVLTIHDLCQRSVPGRFGGAKRAWLTLGQTWSERTAAQVITVSAATRKDLMTYHPGYAGRTVVVHEASKYAIDRTESGPREGFLFVGRLEPGKRLGWAIEAVARLRSEHGIAKRLAVVGARGWMQTGLPALIERLGAADLIDFKGYVSDEELRQLYRQAECLVFTSAYEGFGLPILEAQSQGCPVISADNSSLREVGGDGACHYFPTEDRDALLAHLLRSQREPEAFRAVREEGFRNCLRFDWERAAAGTLDAYRRALQKLD
jgi:glycosyltransferase involved in cell wall biosynthesis